VQRTVGLGQASRVDPRQRYVVFAHGNMVTAGTASG
jgi:hypothetical protein